MKEAAAAEFARMGLVLSSFMLEDPPYFEKERVEKRKARLRVDYWGIIFIALGLGFLQIVLGYLLARIAISILFLPRAQALASAARRHCHK